MKKHTPQKRGTVHEQHSPQVTEPPERLFAFASSDAEQAWLEFERSLVDPDGDVSRQVIKLLAYAGGFDGLSPEEQLRRGTIIRLRVHHDPGRELAEAKKRAREIFFRERRFREMLALAEREWQIIADVRANRRKPLDDHRGEGPRAKVGQADACKDEARRLAKLKKQEQPDRRLKLIAEDIKESFNHWAVLNGHKEREVSTIRDYLKNL